MWETMREVGCLQHSGSGLGWKGEVVPSYGI